MGYTADPICPCGVLAADDIDALFILSAISDSSPLTERLMLFPSDKVAIEDIIGSVFLLIFALERE